MPLDTFQSTPTPTPTPPPMQFGFFSFVGDEAVMHAQPGCPDLLTILCEPICRELVAALKFTTLEQLELHIAHEAWAAHVACGPQPAACPPAGHTNEPVAHILPPTPAPHPVQAPASTWV